MVGQSIGFFEIEGWEGGGIVRYWEGAWMGGRRHVIRDRTNC